MALFGPDTRTRRFTRRLTQIGAAQLNSLNPIQRALHFIRETIWVDDPGLSRLQRFFYPKLRVLVLAVWNFQAHGAPTHAAALTYTSLLALVPVIAVALSLFQVFGGLEEIREKVQSLIVQYLAPGLEETMKERLNAALLSIREGARANAALAAVLLFVTTIRTLSTLEFTANKIAGAKRGRSWSSRVTVYWAVATLGPVLLGASIAMTASVEKLSFVRWLDERAHFLDVLYRIAPTFLTCGAFTLLYLFLPNTKIRPRAAIVGGVVAGLAFEIAKRGFTAGSVSLIRSYNELYGSIATLFVFLFWLYISWTILLIGLELVVAVQSATTHRKEELATKVSQRFKEMIALRMVTEISERFYEGKPPPVLEKLASALDLPVRLLCDVLGILESRGIVREIEVEDEQYAYIPGRILERITVEDILNALREEGAANLTVREDEETRYLEEVVRRTDEAQARITGRETMRQIVERFGEWKREQALRGRASSDSEAARPHEDGEPMPYPAPAHEPA